MGLLLIWPRLIEVSLNGSLMLTEFRCGLEIVIMIMEDKISLTCYVKDVFSK